MDGLYDGLVSSAGIGNWFFVLFGGEEITRMMLYEEGFTP